MGSRQWGRGGGRGDPLRHAARATSPAGAGEEQDHHPAHDSHISDEDADRAYEEGESEAASIITERSRIARPLPIDADEVSVERRLYRDGKSQYLINGSRVRLKDIQQLTDRFVKEVDAVVKAIDEIEARCKAAAAE